MTGALNSNLMEGQKLRGNSRAKIISSHHFKGFIYLENKIKVQNFWLSGPN